MTRIRTVHHDEWDDQLWSSHHEYRKAKAAQHRNKGEKKSTIRQGINDYFEKSKLKRNISDDVQDWINPDEPFDDIE
ncbi:hypothetical protein [Endozoicomonas ascidiicola]|uniref:hypothetical protein n=1 Tax=Endozoicomonas ascidiicola TaxID=1698521 RepID=UPI000833F403|nr:hypothetical protein [Endozoicomonas ascidiicola]